MSRLELSTKVGGATILILLSVAAARLFFHPQEVPQSSRPHEPVGEAILPPPRTGPEPAPPVTRAVVVDNGTLSLALHQQRLGPVLVEIAHRSGLTINSSPSVDARSVTIQFQRLPLREGLEKLLQNCDTFFYSTSGSLQSLWVYERGAGAELAPVPPERWASTADVERKLTDGSPSERVSAVQTLIARKGAGVDEILSRALLDENADVRLRALDVALSVGVNVSRETLMALTYDSSAPVRALALEAIAGSTAVGGPHEGETDEVFRRMLGDSDATVRSKASELLSSRHSE